MKYEEVCKCLLDDFPDIKKWEDDSELSERDITRPYYMALCFVYYLFEKSEKDELETIKRGFSFIENLLISGDERTKTLVESGFLPGIHIINSSLGAVDDKFLEFMGVETKNAYDKLKKGDIRNYYPDVAINPEISSVDESNILDIKVVGNDLLLQIDHIYYFRNGKSTTMENDSVVCCCLLIKDFKLISEIPIAEYTKTSAYKKTGKRGLKIAEKNGLSLYMNFEDFLCHNNIGVQEFAYDYEKNTICIAGYDNSHKNSVWVGLTFQFSNLCLYWNDEFLNHEYDEKASYKEQKPCE